MTHENYQRVDELIYPGPETLSGRESEYETLFECYDRVANSSKDKETNKDTASIESDDAQKDAIMLSRSELVIIRGETGVGMYIMNLPE